VSAPGWEAHLPAGTDAGSIDLLARGTLPEAWVSNWREAPEAPVLLYAGRGWLRAAELEEASRYLAGGLLAAGLEVGDRMLFSAPTSVELVIAHVAALRAGLVVVPANTAYREREIAHIVADSQPRAAFVDDPERAAWVQSAADEMLMLGPGSELPEHEPAALDPPSPEDPALIGYTSGTTGRPKGAVLSHANLLAGSESVGLAWRWSAEDRLVLALPLFHSHGLCVGLHGTLLAGASAVLLPRFDVDSVLDAAAEHEATLFFGVPTMYQRLARSPRIRELARLRLCVSGSAPLAAQLHQAITVASGQQVLERYGMTETLMNVSNPYDGERRPGSVGLPLPGVELRLSEDGEILLRGPNVFRSYWRQGDATAASFQDGWFCTGDIGAFDDDGYLRILGRSKELIITGGLNVYPREVEDVLLAHPDVAEVAVVGTPSDEWGEVVTAFVVSSADRPAEAPLIEFAAERLAAFKRPRRVQFVDSLPRNALGKVLKHEL
jgi:malonyl-CoA/methylmalonyl-CoA synthetase